MGGCYLIERRSTNGRKGPMQETDLRHQYVTKQLGLLMQKRLTQLTMLTAGLFLFFMVFDYYLSPAILLRFLPHRIIISMAMALLVVLNRRHSDLGYQQMLTIAGVTAVAAAIEIISISFKEHNYFYYNGMHLIVIGTLGFLPLGGRLSLAVMGIIYLIFVIPVIVFDTHSLTAHPFIMVNAYLLSTCVLAYTWRISHQRTLVDWLKLQYGLHTDKKSLQTVVQTQSREIEKSEIMLGQIIRNARDGIIIMDRRGNILKANESACRIYDLERTRILGENITAVGDDTGKRIWGKQLESLSSNDHLLFEIDHHKEDGIKMTYEVNVNMIKMDGEEKIQAFYRDLTERRKLQQQVLLAQKMESVGTLASGIAHDFKNMLSTVQSFADYIRRMNRGMPNCDMHEMIAESADIIEGEVKNASQVVSQLLSLGKKGNVDFCLFDLNTTIQNVAGLYSKIMPQVKIVTALESPPPYIYGNKGLVEQTLANLIINASEAMPNGGSITLCTELTEKDVRSVSVPGGAGDGKYARIRVSDDGVGISGEHLPHIFDPFYTTKADHAKPGTGLGLSMVYGIVKEHGGDVTVESAVGKGTTFCLYFPATGNGHVGKRFSDH